MRENVKRWATGVGLVAVGAALVVTVLVDATPAEAKTKATGTRVTARWTGAINTRSLAQVNAAYWSQYASKLSLSTGWLGGSLTGCLPGVSSATANAATLSALNYVRSLAGLAPVRMSSTLNANAQRAALIMSANGALNHNPDRSWKCYSSSGAAAAGRSNLVLAYPTLKAGQIIDLYMDDPGANNTAVGHRRWLLNPFTTKVGIGSTNTANALTVIGPSNRHRPNPKYIGWPTAGYFPNAIEPNGRWSLSAGRSDVSFKKARVKVFLGSKRIPVRKYKVHTGYAQPTIVWQMPAGFDKTATYRVVVKKIKRSGTHRMFHKSYKVRLFTPTS